MALATAQPETSDGSAWTSDQAASQPVSRGRRVRLRRSDVQQQRAPGTRRCPLLLAQPSAAASSTAPGVNTERYRGSGHSS